MRKTMATRTTMAMVAAVTLTVLGPLEWSVAGSEPETARPPVYLRTGEPFLAAPIDARGRTPGADDLAAIVARANERGSVRVILGLPQYFVPEGLLDARAAREQRSAIGKGQEELLGRLTGVEEVVHRYASIPFVNVVLSPSGAQALAGIEGLASAQLDAERRLSLATSTPFVGAPVAWGRGFDGTGQTIAILDTGVDSTHPFLAGTVVDEACFGDCPNGGRWQIGPGAGVPLPSSVPGFDHGTHVAGIAAGHRTQNVSFQGVAPGAGIMSINVSHRSHCFPFGPCAATIDGDILAGLQYVFDRRGAFNIAAVNMSFGGDARFARCPGSAYDFAIANLLSAGIASVASSGNAGLANAIDVPACVPGVLSVGSVTASGLVAAGSNSASFLNLLAPGVGITSSVPGGGFASMSGTSMAAPHVSGAFALMKQRDPAAYMNANLQALIQSGPKVFDPRNGVLTARIRVDSALARPAVFDHDFTRDRAADPAVWRASTHEWWIYGAPSPVLWGDVGDVPVPGDYNGDGTTDIAVFRAATHEWWITSEPGPVLWGDPGDKPIPADYDGDGKIDIAVWRASIGAWFVRGQFGMLHGLPTDIPVPADYDNDGKADLMLYRPSTGQWINLNGSVIGWGAPGDIPVPADYDGSGSADIAVYRPSTGEWFVRNQFTEQLGGQPGDIPMPRDDQGSGRASLAVWRPSTGQWIIGWPGMPWIQQVITWGGPNDIPL